MNTLAKSNGVPYVVRYLKACSVLLQQSRGGYRYSSTRDLGLAVSRTKSGIPRVIPAIHRRLIYKDRRYVIAWMTLFGIYRVLVFPGKLSVKTITEPGRLLTGELIMGLRGFIETFF